MHSDLGISCIVIHFADGRIKAFCGGYFTSLYWWPALLWGPRAWRYLGNDNQNASAEIERSPNVAPCAWPGDLLSLFDCPERGTVNDRP